MQRFILNICGSFFIVFILLASTGCANKDVARKDYAQGNYEASYAIWEKWVNRGYYDANIELLKILHKSAKNIDYEEMKKMALDAYNAGEKQSAFVLEDLYLINGDLKNAYIWMGRGDFTLSSLEDFRNHLHIIENYNISTMQQKDFLTQLEAIAKKSNIDASIALGDFYARNTNLFYDLKRSEYFYQNAYNLGNKDAGIELAKSYIYNSNRENEGLKILQLLSKQGNAKASYEVGNLMLDKVNTLLQKKNNFCIATSFHLPHEFYLNKIYAKKSRKAYIMSSVVPWYKKAYKQNNLDALLKLISLDIQEDTLKEKETFSQMNFEEMERFLQNHKENQKALKLLTHLYQSYQSVVKFDTLESIYLESMEENVTAATWNLYQLYKDSNVSSQQADAYLQELVLQGFQPAILEQSYNNILNSTDVKKNIELLLSRADRGDKEALKSLVSLYNKEFTKDINYFPYLEQTCQIEPNNKALDMKIAHYYLKNGNLDKATTILEYYAQSDDNMAQYKLSKLYANLQSQEHEAYWLKIAKENGNNKAEIEYHIKVIQGAIQADVAPSVQYLENYAQMGNVDAIRVLAQAYTTGSMVDFNPEVAKSYYLLLVQKGEISAYLDIIDLYQKINIDRDYDNSIDQVYKMAIENNVDHAKIKYAKFLISRDRINEAKTLLLTLSLKHEPLARALLYKITAQKYYLSKNDNSNNGEFLMQYAKKISQFSKQDALLSAFRAHLCNTPSTGLFTYDLLRSINDERVIENIYKKAKGYPQCTNQQ